MCGITGVVAFNQQGRSFLEKIGAATAAMARRGPDHEGIYSGDMVALGHRRLSIIDTSAAANQPMYSANGNSIIVFNGEFYNFNEHRQSLVNSGVSFKTHSDTEVLLYGFMSQGKEFLKNVNGFFAFALYHPNQNKCWLVRDRLGIKPLYYYLDQDKLIFASEIKSILQFGIRPALNYTALSDYLHLNYVPGNNSIFENIKKVPPGHLLEITPGTENNAVKLHSYYSIPDNYRSGKEMITDYNSAKKELQYRLDAAVQRRLVADVPLGAFLSGGIDSSVVTGLASRHTKQLRTFSIGFRDEPHFDETHYAELVAKKFKTDHTVFSLTTDDLYNGLHQSIDYLDEPFADSSALAVNILSQHTRKAVTVALSGDGADELLGGYNKHRAEWMIRNRPFVNAVMKPAAALLKGFHGSRNSPLSNKVRQIKRYGEGVSLSPQERYWRWCGFTNDDSIIKLLKQSADQSAYADHVAELLAPLGKANDMNDVFYMDMHMVLPDDMLVKVDRMSMAHSLEVRSPFLDKEVVQLGFAIPAAFKIDANSQKKILKDAFADLLPDELHTRNKQGFEVPLLKWLREGLDKEIRALLLDEEFIASQKVFNLSALKALYASLHSTQPGDAAARVWALYVFQNWYKKYFLSN